MTHTLSPRCEKRSPNCTEGGRTAYDTLVIAPTGTGQINALIGFGVVLVLDLVPGISLTEIKLQQAYFAIPAAITFALGTVLLLTLDRRILWILGAFLQIFIIYTYFDLATQRTPTYEMWGILIRITQMLLLVTLVYLAVRPSPTQFSTHRKHSRTLAGDEIQMSDGQVAKGADSETR